MAGPIVTIVYLLTGRNWRLPERAPGRSRGRGAGVLMALSAVLLVVFAVNMHPASAAAGAETRVGASGESIEPFVGPPQHVSPGQGRGSRVSYDSFVVATGVAANAGGGGASTVVPSVEALDATWIRLGFASRNDFGEAAWGGRSLSGAAKLKTPEQVAKMRDLGLTVDDAQGWRNFYLNIHEKSVARFPNNPEKINPSAQYRADLFQYYMDNL